jgi:UDP-N-acetylmuramyl pentapeptide phosphotransferase/UDP-N-acetylglucosamine-1-phosphate transferase
VSVVLAFVVGLLAVRFVMMSGRGILETPMLLRRNYRDRLVPTAAGVFAVLAVLVVEAGRSTLGAFGVGDEPGHDLARPLILFACVGFGLLGFVDDVLGSEEDRGFRGHLQALAHGRLTTGSLKIIGGAAIALVLVGTGGDLVSGKRLVADAVLIALAANLGNLLDRAPGRVVKVAVIAWIPVAIVAGTDAVGISLAPVIGAFVGLFGDDLREHVMLGDTGAYVLGAVLGLATVLEVGRGPRNGVLAALVALTIAAEFVSFSRVIERVPPLRALDQLGRGRRDAPSDTGR